MNNIVSSVLGWGLVALALLAQSAAAQTAAEPVDVSGLVSGVDYSSITENVISAGTIMIAATLAVIGVRWILKVMK